MIDRRTVIFVGALPPPVHGQAKVNEQVVNDLGRRANLVVVNTSGGQLKKTPRYHWRKLCGICRAVAVIIRTARQNPVLFLSVDAGYGLIYNAVMVASARHAGCSIWLQYQSFSYIDTFSGMVDLVVRLGGADTNHVFLCDAMGEKFNRRYHVSHRHVCSNARFSRLLAPLARTRDPEWFRIGLLSNLNREKGLYDFLEVLRKARQRQLPIRGTIAGPLVLPHDGDAVHAASLELGGRLEVRGPIYGADVGRFYGEIDAFVFPTRYRIEAQPIVLMEALGNGVPVISFARGCIAEEVTSDAGLVVPQGADFAELAVQQLERWIAEPDEYAAAQQAAHRLGRHHFDRSVVDYDRLLANVAGAP